MKWVIGLLVLLVGCSSITGCPDRACLIENAKQCNSAIFVDEGVEYRIANDCTLTKSIISVENEPPVIADHIRGKSMVCSYNAIAFDEELVQKVTGRLDLCTGALKEALYELKIAQDDILIGG